MFLAYIDESGDIGLNNSPSRYFCLSAMLIHESDWHSVLNQIIHFRQSLKERYGLKLREEIHSSHFIHKPKDLQRIHKSLRVRLLRDVLEFQSQLNAYKIINVAINKKNKNSHSDIFNLSWQSLIKEIDDFMTIHNQQLNTKEKVILFVDKTDEVKLRTLNRELLRSPKIHNSVSENFGYRKFNTKFIIEDAVHRDSAHSFFIQMADVNAYFLNQKFEPCQYIKKKGGRHYFDKLIPILANKITIK